MAKATGFEDDTVVLSGEDAEGAVELSEREKAIAQGKDPDQVGADDTDDVEEAEGDEAEATDGESTEDAASGEDEGKDAPGSDWIDDDVKALAESYGVDEETLATFESASDFKRFATIYEKRLAAEPEPTKAEKKAAEPVEDEADDDVPDIKWFEENGYDEQTIKVVKGVLRIKELQGRIDQLEQRLAEGDKQREQELLHREIDELGGRFGKSDSLTSAQKKARAKLLETAEVVSASLEKRGEKASRSVVLKRAELVAFGDEILAEERAKQQEALLQSVKKQSAKRRSVGRNTKPPTRSRPGEAADPVKAIANHPDIVAFWKDAQDE